MLISRISFNFKISSLFYGGQHFIVFLLHVLLFFIQLCKTVKFNGITGRFKGTAFCVNCYRHCIKKSVCHLACNKSFPDKLIYLKLVGSKTCLDSVRRKLRQRRTYSFMCVLSIFSFDLNTLGDGGRYSLP